MKHLFRSVAVASLLALSAISAFAGFFDQYQKADEPFVKEHIGKEDVVVVDVRDKEIYDGQSPREGIPGGHIPGAVNFTLSDLKGEADQAQNLEGAGITKDKTVVLYCNSGRMSGEAADILIDKYGFDKAKVYNYKGSVIDWTKAGNTLEP